jgi:hypothetical protein
MFSHQITNYGSILALTFALNFSSKIMYPMGYVSKSVAMILVLQKRDIPF